MSINFPLILVLGTLITGLVWLVDIVALRPRRKKASERAREKLEAGKAGETAVEEILREPVVVEYAISFFPVLAIVLILRSFLFNLFRFPLAQ